jgi:hypothetical protein
VLRCPACVYLLTYCVRLFELNVEGFGVRVQFLDVFVWRDGRGHRMVGSVITLHC